MRVRREHRKVEGGVICCHLEDLLLCEVEQFRVLVAPPDLVALGDVIVQFGVLVVKDLVSAVPLEIQFPAAEIRDGTAHEHLVVAFFCKDVAQHGRAGIEGIRVRRSGVADTAVAVHGDA